MNILRCLHINCNCAMSAIVASKYGQRSIAPVSATLSMYREHAPGTDLFGRVPDTALKLILESTPIIPAQAPK